MLRFIVSALVLSPMIAFGAAQKKLAVDTTDSQVKWSGSKALVDTKHYGTVKLSDKSFLTVKGDKVVGGEIIIDMTSISNQDQTDATYKAKLEGHLKSEDFFAVEKYKEAKFVIKKVTPQSTPSQQLFEGDLTIRDVTQPAKIVATVSKDGKSLTATGKLDIDRTKYNVKYGSHSAFPNLIKAGKDKVISDQIALDFTVKTKK